MSFSVQPVELDERPETGESPEHLAARLASCKAVEGARRSPGSVVLGADTVVAFHGSPLGKPQSPADARRMLHNLRGRTHQVITSVAAARVDPAQPAPRQWARTSVAEVTMREYTDAEIEEYVASGDPLDKAGAYAIQHPGFQPVARLNGCYLTVVGLALPEVFAVLREAGFPIAPVRNQDLATICPDCFDRARLPVVGAGNARG